jgi:HK97 family phage major capsid protein
MSFQSKEIIEQRGQICKSMQDLLAKAKDNPDKSLTQEQRDQFDRMDADQVKLQDQAETLLRQEKMASMAVVSNNEPVQTRSYKSLDPRKKQATQNDAFNAWIKHKAGCLGYDEEQSCQGYDVRSERFNFDMTGRYPRMDKMQIRTSGPQTEANGSGGELVPTIIPADISTYILANSPIRQVARQLVTPNGDTFNYPTSDDTTSANYAQIVGINTQNITGQYVPTNKSQSVVYMYQTLVLVPLQLIQDSVINIQDYVTQEMGRRFLYGTSAHLAVGTGSGQPQGLSGVCSVGVTTAANTGPTYAELLNWEAAVPLFYRNRPDSAFVVSDSLGTALRALVDSDGRPLWNPFMNGIIGGDSDTLLGHKLVRDPWMAATGTNGHIIGVFGAMQEFVYRNVEQDALTIVVAKERFIDYAQIGLYGFARFGTFGLQTGGLKSLST